MRAPLPIITLAILMFACSVFIACGGGGDDDDVESPTPTEATSPSPTEKPGIEDLAHAVVQILPLDASGNPVWHGSGTILDRDGLILTNAHVVEETGEWTDLGVALIDRSDAEPELRYIAEIDAIDYALDLAVIQITGTVDGGQVTENFPFVEVGDSDAVEIGDGIQVLGYPSIGGSTITFTQGAVSGFTTEREVGNRAWIKTDATIAGGNSGGLAVNENLQLIGVPSVAGSGSHVNYVDCRLLEDTNGDGALDDSDTCVPVGGFINGLRPIKLALALIEAAQAGDLYVSPYYEPEDGAATPAADYPIDLIDFSRIIFGPDVTLDNVPSQVAVTLPSDPQNVCAFWDYEGMADGLDWDALWYVNGELDEEASVLDSTWTGGESGTDWWACTRSDFGLPDGLFEIILQVQGELITSAAIYVGNTHELVSLRIDNTSSKTICAAAVAPSLAQNWGGDDLGPDTILFPGDSATIEVGTGEYDILLIDCDSEVILEDYGVIIAEDSVYTVSD